MNTKKKMMVMCNQQSESRGTDDEDGPQSLADLVKGEEVNGDSGADPTKPPDWFVRSKYEKGRKIFEKHAMSFVLTWHFSLVMGFCIKPLLQALVFTKASSTPKDAFKRYLNTYVFLAKWHLGDVFDASDDDPAGAYLSVQGVRTFHATTRANMEKSLPSNVKYMNQYDMGLVQTGFMGALTITPSGFGMRLSDEEIDDYVYFWRCVARQLGVMDAYNLCGRGNPTATKLTWEIVDKVLLPSEGDAPEPDYETIVTAYLKGMNDAIVGIPLWSLRAMQAYSYETMGRTLPGPRLSCADRLRLVLYKCMIAMFLYVPGFAWLANTLCIYALGSNVLDNGKKCSGPPLPTLKTLRLRLPLSASVPSIPFPKITDKDDGQLVRFIKEQQRKYFLAEFSHLYFICFALKCTQTGLYNAHGTAVLARIFRFCVERMIKEALEIILDASRHPILVACKSGTGHSSVVVGCLRRLQGWNLTSIFFGVHGLTHNDRQRIERFEPDTIRRVCPDRVPDFDAIDREMTRLEEERIARHAWRCAARRRKERKGEKGKDEEAKKGQQLSGAEIEDEGRPLRRSLGANTTPSSHNQRTTKSAVPKRTSGAGKKEQGGDIGGIVGIEEKKRGTLFCSTLPVEFLRDATSEHPLVSRDVTYDPKRSLVRSND
eukprot:g314.t1